VRAWTVFIRYLARSRTSPNGGHCLEAKKLPGGRVALRQSTDPGGPALILEPNEIAAFVHGALAGSVSTHN
jgi:hypothetical protein